MKSKWEVHTKGGPGTGFEICVIREDNAHGHKSYGWYGADKIFISDFGGPCTTKVDKRIWDKLVKVAQEVAAEFNELEAKH